MSNVDWYTLVLTIHTNISECTCSKDRINIIVDDDKMMNEINK